MNDSTTDNALRLCPVCGAASAIGSSRHLWPTDWHCSACGGCLDVAGGVVRLASELDEVDDGFSLDSFEKLAAIEEGHFWFATRNRMIAWLIRRHAPTAKRVLELGSGTGFTMCALREALPSATITGSELHRRGLVYAQQRHSQGVEFLQMDARRISLDGVIDLVGAFDVLEHIADDRGVIEQIRRALRPQGVLIATVPQHPWLWSAADELAHHQRRYRRGELASKLRDAGLRVVYRTSFAALSLPLLAVMRLRGRKVMAEAETCPPPAANLALTYLFDMEHALRRVGVPLPVGGSQVVVATKSTD